MTPYSPNSGLVRLYGNLCSGALARTGVLDQLADHDQKLYLADFFLGSEELDEASAKPKGPLERLRKKTTRDDLYRIWRINWADRAGSNGAMDQAAQWDKNRLWNHLVDERLLRVILFVGGEGPRASGMPEVDLAHSRSRFYDGCIIATDGRVVFGERSLSIAHIVPEVIDGGGLASVRTADWVYLNLKKGELHIVTALRGAPGYKVLSARQLSRRPETKKRISQVERRRASFLPSVRSVFDSVSSAAEGLSPVTV
jgi:dihydroxy-acid dehydratase